jgi:restriction system-associated AAA family ATPase
MKLLRVGITAAETCGGLLDGLDLQFRSASDKFTAFDPLCFIGRNGVGKSQFLQVLAEIFQSAVHACARDEERIESNPKLQFEIEYLIRPTGGEDPVHVRIWRKPARRGRLELRIGRREDGEWVDCDLNAPETRTLLPKKVVGYSSGENETLSLPFLVSRSGYAREVSHSAKRAETRGVRVPDTRLMLIDYGTHLEVLVANLLLGEKPQRAALLSAARLEDLHSFRCTIQLNHGAAPTNGVQLTDELNECIERLRLCATCYDHHPGTNSYTFDFFITEETRRAFRYFWDDALALYTSFHKLAMLNDLVIPKRSRERFRRELQHRRFAALLPEPQEEDKVFRFERVEFRALSGGIVDYVSLSDGEHQLAQVLGTLGMISFPNVLFLLDEPESHFNPEWRVQFIAGLLNLPTINGRRGENCDSAEQECLISTHSPFVPSDMSRENVLIFRKADRVEWNRPEIETYGATFDTILEECFDIRPPISKLPRDEIEELMDSSDPEKIRSGIERFGDSLEKAYLLDRLQQLTGE